MLTAPPAVVIGEWAFYLITEGGEEIYYVVKLMFEATNNEVEYKAQVAGLVVAKGLGKEIDVHANFQVVVNQEKRECLAKEEILKMYMQRV